MYLSHLCFGFWVEIYFVDVWLGGPLDASCACEYQRMGVGRWVHVELSNIVLCRIAKSHSMYWVCLLSSTWHDSLSAFYKFLFFPFSPFFFSWSSVLCVLVWMHWFFCMTSWYFKNNGCVDQLIPIRLVDVLNLVLQTLLNTVTYS